MSDILLLSTSDTEIDNEAHFQIETQFDNFTSSLTGVVQAFISNLLTDETTDATDKSRGGGLYSVSRKYRSFSDSLVTEISDAIRNVESRMIDEHNEMGLSSKERLKGVNILNIEKRNNNSIYIKLQVVTENNESQIVEL